MRKVLIVTMKLMILVRTSGRRCRKPLCDREVRIPCQMHIKPPSRRAVPANRADIIKLGDAVPEAGFSLANWGPRDQYCNKRYGRQGAPTT